MQLGLPPSPIRVSVPFAAALAAHCDAPALLTRDGALSYAQLAARVDDVARRLGEVRRLVLVAGSNEVEPVVTYLAAMAAGHPVLLVPADRQPALQALVDAYDPDVVAAAGEDGRWRLDERRDGSAHELHPDLALLLSTSGSSGSPKLVRLSHENVQSNAEAIAEYLQIRPTDRAATTLPLHYCYGLSVLNSHLARGAAVVLTDLSVVDGCFWELFRGERATSFAGVPYTFELLDRAGFAAMDLPHLRYVTQAGGRLAPEHVARWAGLGRERGWDLFVMYGQTEATARMAYLPPDLSAEHPQAIGVPIPGGAFALEPVPGAAEDDRVGELIYSGPNVMLGYADAPADLALGRTVEALRTGDLARRTSAGLYEIAGRRSRFVKVLGLRIDLDRAEAVLGACCVGRGEELVVAVDDDRDLRELRLRAAGELGIPAGAVRVLRMATLPRLASGKPDYPAIERRAADADLDARADVGPPGNDGVRPADGDLRSLFAEVLERPDAGPHDTFAGLGGDSLSYVAMSVRLEAALGHLPAGWHVTPIGELESTVRRPRRGGWRGVLGWRALETSVVLRAVAIVLIVGSHAGMFALLGGAHLLVAVAGFNFARFQLGSEGRRLRLRGQLRSVARIAVPAVVWIAFAALLLTDDYGVANVLLLNAWLGPEAWTAQWHFWFVEVLLALLLALAALLALAPVDRAERRWPFGFPLALLAVGLVGRFGLLDLGVPHTRPVLWLFALGWLAARARDGWQRAAVTALVTVTVPGFFGDPQREALIAGGLLLLLWAPAVRVPAAACRAVAVLASASLYVYLTHWQVYRPLDDIPPLAVAASLAVGIVFWQAVERAPQGLGAVVRRLPSSGRRRQVDHSQA